LGERLWRRTRNISIELIVLLLLTGLLPVWLLCGAVVDLVLWFKRRKPWMTMRMVLVLWWALVGEAYALIGIFVIELLTFGRDSERRRALIYELKRQWVRSHFRGLRLFLGLRFEIEGLELAGSGPVFVMTRHASIIDNGLPDGIIGTAHGTNFRFVIKRELQALPTIDIAGRMVPTLFVRRASTDTEGELAKLAALTTDLGPKDGLLLYPEGTRCTPEKLARAKEIIAERQPELAPLADRLKHVLPPRLGGAVTLLRGARHADVVIFGHVGLDGFEKTTDVWAGGLLNTTVKLKFWRHPFATIPYDDHDALVQWLYARWFELDDWIDAQLQAAG
jgi:1-acyl-sn-glycerol-3-phosphate acyltransferase